MSKTLKLGDTHAAAAFAKLTGLNYIESQGPSLVKASAELFS